VRRPVATGSPEELPVLGKTMVNIANHPVPEQKGGSVPGMDGRAHGASSNVPPVRVEKKIEEPPPI